jgi:hypothetical protein
MKLGNDGNRNSNSVSKKHFEIEAYVYKTHSHADAHKKQYTLWKATP